MMNITSYTYNGESSAEKTIQEMLDTISSTVSSLISKQDIKALVLLGGYGKGEGGTIFIDGVNRPHNNFDLLLITENSTQVGKRNIKKIVTQKMKAVSKKLDIGIDISVMSEAKIRSMPTRVLWYDMKEGHKTLLGDKKLIPSLPHLRRDIPSWDMRNLMVNRGSLLLINTVCLQKTDSDHNIQKLIIKHTMKAIIGYGDALLYFLGQYHWSYREKLNRILSHDGISIKFKRIYDSAISFRISPNYQYYLEKDLGKWQQEVCKQLNDTHIECEAKRLNRSGLCWENYLETALSHLIAEQELSFKTLAKCMLNMIRQKSGKLPSNLSFRSKLAYYISNENNISPILFPFLVFNPSLKTHRQETALFISSHFRDTCYQSSRSKQQSQSRTRANFMIIIKSYLSRWGSNFDPNLWQVLEKNSIYL